MVNTGYVYLQLLYEPQYSKRTSVPRNLDLQSNGKGERFVASATPRNLEPVIPCLQTGLQLTLFWSSRHRVKWKLLSVSKFLDLIEEEAQFNTCNESHDGLSSILISQPGLGEAYHPRCGIVNSSNMLTTADTLPTATGVMLQETPTHWLEMCHQRRTWVTWGV